MAITGRRKSPKGPSDDEDAKRGQAALDSTTRTAEGVDAYASKAPLVDVAKRLEIKGRSKMTKAELVDAITKANQSVSARSLRNEQ